MKLLIADDDATMQALLNGLAQRWGYETVVVDNGEDALRLLVAEDPPRIAILDWIMPGLDGVDVCRRLKELPDRPSIYTILLTGKTEREDKIEALDSGAHDFLTKPVDPAELKSRLGVGVRISEYDDVIKEKSAALLHAQKMESVGQLAAGIAHEINTPVQFISDSLYFLRDAIADIQTLLTGYGELADEAAAGQVTADFAQRRRQLEEVADLAYLQQEIPGSLDRTFTGIERVSKIVQAMKQFAHPDTSNMSPVDINQALNNSLTVCQYEYKYVADIETDYGEIPEITGYTGELNQVFLNIIVNAAHAIGEVVGESGDKGIITIRTRRVDDTVVISISDTGRGIPRNRQEKVFEPFYTTKEIGKGTGQGLAICWSVIVDKHNGQLTVESEVGQGTSFHISLPVRIAKTPVTTAETGAPLFIG
ncbi:MAG: ATP-binding protein [bacterium]